MYFFTLLLDQQKECISEFLIPIKSIHFIIKFVRIYSYKIQ